MHRILVTSPPMIGAIGRYTEQLSAANFEVTCPQTTQTLPRDELMSMIDTFDGWIVGDDRVDRQLLYRGKAGKLRAAVKWGIGVDNIDFAAAKSASVSIRNTPDMFGDEIADLAMHYVVGLARETFRVHQGVRDGGWPKPAGLSLAGRTAAVVGYGSVGQALVERLVAAKMNVQVYTRTESRFDRSEDNVCLVRWPDKIDRAEFVVLCCPLTDSTRHILGREYFDSCFSGVRIVNVARGAVIDTSSLCGALRRGSVHSAALDVFEQEPLPENSSLREFEQVVFGSHNASNTVDAVDRTSSRAIDLLVDLLGAGQIESAGGAKESR